MEEESTGIPTTGYSVLIPVSLPASGGPLVQLASALTGNDDEERRILALYLKRPQERDAYRAGIDEEQPPEQIEALQPLLEEAARQKNPGNPRRLHQPRCRQATFPALPGFAMSISF